MSLLHLFKRNRKKNFIRISLFLTAKKSFNNFNDDLVLNHVVLYFIRLLCFFYYFKLIFKYLFK